MNPLNLLPADIAGRLEAYTREKQSAIDPMLRSDAEQTVKAAVLVPLIFLDGEWQLLFERRTNVVATHKGEASFPGGAYENGDESPEETAKREAMEEIGLAPEDVHLIGRLPVMRIFPVFEVTPVVAWIEPSSEFSLCEAEVVKVFTVPLKWLADPDNSGDQIIIHNGVEVPVLHYKPYRGEQVWGATAYLARSLARLIA